MSVQQLVAGIITLAALAAAPVTASAAGKPDTVGGTVTVLAASSLTEAFTVIGTAFERTYPDATVTFSFNSSSTLATQVEQGAPADVFASADEANMMRLEDAGLVGQAGDPFVFARNRLAIAVEPGNPEKIKTLADTVADDVILVLCAPEVPCGTFALEAYGNAGIDVPRVPTGVNVKDTLAKVALGEADAAIVYATDVKAAKGDVDGIKIPGSQNVVARYPIAPLADAPNGAAAKAFVRFVDEQGQRILRRFGFLEP